MASFATNMAAMNAARKQFGKEWKASCKVEKVDGQWYVQLVQAEPAPDTAPESASAPEVGVEDCTEKVQEELGQQNAPATPEPVDAREFELATQNADKIANAQQATGMKHGRLWIRLSSVEKPTKRVWDIADEMRGMAENEAEQSAQPVRYPTRTEVQDECERRGIASGTARTQYQAWKKANDNARANAEKAAELSKRFNRKD